MRTRQQTKASERAADSTRGNNNSLLQKCRPCFVKLSSPETPKQDNAQKITGKPKTARRIERRRATLGSQTVEKKVTPTSPSKKLRRRGSIDMRKAACGRSTQFVRFSEASKNILSYCFLLYIDSASYFHALMIVLFFLNKFNQNG